MLTRERLLNAIKNKPLPISTCSMCGYECSFSFKGDALGYDSGCDCTYGAGGWQPRSEDDLDFYLNPEHNWIEKLKMFCEETEKENPMPDSSIPTKAELLRFLEVVDKMENLEAQIRMTHPHLAIFDADEVPVPEYVKVLAWIKAETEAL